MAFKLIELDERFHRIRPGVRVVGMLGGKADLVLSDMAPNTTGDAATDHLRIVALAEGGGFVAKMFQGGRGRCWRG